MNLSCMGNVLSLGMFFSELTIVTQVILNFDLVDRTMTNFYKIEFRICNLTLFKLF